MRLRRRHDLVAVFRGDTPPELTLIRSSGLDGGGIISDAIGSRLSLGALEPQLRLALARIRPVAGKAPIGEDRPDVPVEGQLLGEGIRCAQEYKRRRAFKCLPLSPESASWIHVLESWMRVTWGRER